MDGSRPKRRHWHRCRRHRSRWPASADADLVCTDQWTLGVCVSQSTVQCQRLGIGRAVARRKLFCFDLFEIAGALPRHAGRYEREGKISKPDRDEQSNERRLHGQRVCGWFARPGEEVIDTRERARLGRALFAGSYLPPKLATAVGSSSKESKTVASLVMTSRSCRRFVGLTSFSLPPCLATVE